MVIYYKTAPSRCPSCGGQECVALFYDPETTEPACVCERCGKRTPPVQGHC